jgi:putative Mn2+ efflux pump MntP
MTLVGWLAGKTVVDYVSGVDHWVAFGLLLFVGVRMIRGGLRKAGDEPSIPDPSRGLTLVMLSIATSICACGWLPAFLSVNVLWAALLISGYPYLPSGLLLGNQLGLRLGSRGDLGGHLIGIGLRMLIAIFWIGYIPWRKDATLSTD